MKKSKGNSNLKAYCVETGRRMLMKLCQSIGLNIPFLTVYSLWAYRRCEWYLQCTCLSLNIGKMKKLKGNWKGKVTAVRERTLFSSLLHNITLFFQLYDLFQTTFQIYSPRNENLNINFIEKFQVHRNHLKLNSLKFQFKIDFIANYFKLISLLMISN